MYVPNRNNFGILLPTNFVHHVNQNQYTASYENNVWKKQKKQSPEIECSNIAFSYQLKKIIIFFPTLYFFHSKEFVCTIQIS